MGAFAALVYNSAFAGLTWQNLVMFAVGGVLIFLAIRKRYEPLLLIPIGFGAILANLSYALMSASVTYEQGTGLGHPLLQMAYDVGIRTEFLPPIMRLLTTTRERAIDVPQAKPVSQTAVILFPIVTAALAALAVPACAPRSAC